MSAGNAERVDPNSLKKIYLFNAFDDEQLAAIIEATERISLTAGQRLFNHGDEIRRFYYVESGRMKLYRLSSEGYEKVIDLVGPRQTFAEAVVFMEPRSGYPVHADAVAATELLGFDAKTFLDLLKQSNESCLRLLGIMSKRLRWQVNEIDRLTLHNATSRFIRFILSPAEGSGATADSRIEFDVPKNVLASRLSIQPETFSRILSRLSAASLIRVEKQAITILDLEGLREQLEIQH